MKTLIILLTLALGSCTLADQQYFNEKAVEYAKYRMEKKFPVEPYKISTDAWMVDPESGK